MNRFYAAALINLAFASQSLAESPFFFEIPGDRINVGSWSVVIQDDAAIMVMMGESRLRKFPDTLETSAPQSGLQIMCNAGTISINALLPEAEMLRAGAHEENFGQYILWLNDDLIGRADVPVSNVVTEGDKLIIPIASMRQMDDSLNRFLDAETLTVRAAPMSITSGMITATYSLSHTREAFSHLAKSCGWNEP